MRRQSNGVTLWAMPSAEVISYTVQVGRLGLLGSERQLVIRHQRRGENVTVEAANSEISFSDRFSGGGGFHTSDHGAFVRAFLPLADFTAWLDLLRNEDPVYLHWSVAAAKGDVDTDGLIHLSTGPEPTGEGPVDMSPAHGT